MKRLSAILALAVTVGLAVQIPGAGGAAPLVAKSYPTYLVEVRPVLGQYWQALENWRGQHFMTQPGDSNTENSAEVEQLLDQWWVGLEAWQNRHFLTEPTATNLDTAVELHTLLNTWQSALESARGHHFLLEPPSPYVRLTTRFTGKATLSPKSSAVDPGERLQIDIGWKVPVPNSWHDLETIDLRVCGRDGLLRVRWHELVNSASLLDPRGGRVIERGTLGERGTLSSPTAELFLATSEVTAAGPEARKMTLTLDLAFKRAAAGSDCAIHLAATDELGSHDGFARAGRIVVRD